MIALGKSPTVLTHGDHFPARLYRGKHQLGRYQKKRLSGRGEGELGEPLPGGAVGRDRLGSREAETAHRVEQAG